MRHGWRAASSGGMRREVRGTRGMRKRRFCGGQSDMAARIMVAVNNGDARLRHQARAPRRRAKCSHLRGIHVLFTTNMHTSAHMHTPETTRVRGNLPMYFAPHSSDNSNPIPVPLSRNPGDQNPRIPYPLVTPMFMSNCGVVHSPCTSPRSVNSSQHADPRDSLSSTRLAGD